MLNFKSAKIYFCFAVLLLVAKPFLGFTIANSLRSPIESNILVKSFTKRLLEFSENSSLNEKTIQKKLADPVTDFLLTFSALLGILFPLLFGLDKTLSKRSLQEIQLSIAPRGPAYLLNGKFII